MKVAITSPRRVLTSSFVAFEPGNLWQGYNCLVSTSSRYLSKSIPGINGDPLYEVLKPKTGTLANVSTISFKFLWRTYLPSFQFQSLRRYSSTGRSSMRMCWASLEGSLLRRLRKMSTIFAIVWVKIVSCFGSSSERVIRLSRVPV
jgi:hypothetical protein